MILIPNLPWMIGAGLALGGLAIAGWIFTTWLRIRHGYPLEGAWGQAIQPKVAPEAIERIRLLTGDNAQLRAELGSVKDRLATIERIVTDGTYRLENDIENLRSPKN